MDLPEYSVLYSRCLQVDFGLARGMFWRLFWPAEVLGAVAAVALFSSVPVTVLSLCDCVCLAPLPFASAPSLCAVSLKQDCRQVCLIAVADYSARHQLADDGRALRHGTPHGTLPCAECRPVLTPMNP